MIQRKKKVCKSCGEEKYIFSHGRCQECARIEDYKPLKNSQSKNKKEKSLVLTDFFNTFVSENKAMCQETKKSLSGFSRVNVCHIFPKRKYESVMTNTNNIMIYSLEMHTIFDNHLDKMEFDKLEEKFPNSWKEVCEKVSKMLEQGEILEQGNLKYKFENYLFNKL